MNSGRRSHNVGRILRQLRRENGWTLSAVSAKTSVAVSTLSKIENEQTSPNYDVLLRLCEGLQLDLTEFFQVASFSSFAHGSRTVNRVGDGIRYETSAGECHVLSDELKRKALHPRLVRERPEERPGVVRVHAHPGEEFVYIVSGRVRFHMEPYSPTDLTAGESVHFDAQMPHGWVVLGDEEAVALVVRQWGRLPDEEKYEEDVAC